MGNNQSSSSLPAPVRKKAGSKPVGKEESNVDSKTAECNSTPTSGSPGAGTYRQNPIANAFQQCPKAEPLLEDSTEGSAPLQFVPMLLQKQPPSPLKQQQQQQQQRNFRASSSMHSRTSGTTRGSATLTSTDTLLLSDDQQSPGIDRSRMQTLLMGSSLPTSLARSNMLCQPSVPLSPSDPQSQLSVPLSQSGLQSQSSVPLSPSGRLYQPSVPISPSGFRSQPSVPLSPSGFQCQPSVPLSQSGPWSQPSVPLSPSSLQSQPSVPLSPSGLQSQPSVPLRPGGFQSQPSVPLSPGGFQSQSSVSLSHSGRLYQEHSADQQSPRDGRVDKGLTDGWQQPSGNSDSAQVLEACVDLPNLPPPQPQQQQQQQQQQQESQEQQQQLQQQQGQGHTQQGLLAPCHPELRIIHAPRPPRSVREIEAAAERATAGTTTARNGKDVEEVKALLESVASCQTGLGLSQTGLRHSYSAPGDCNEAKHIILSLIYGRYIPHGKRLPQQAQDSGGQVLDAQGPRQGQQDLGVIPKPSAQPAPKSPPSHTASVLGVGSPALAEQFALIWGGGSGKGKGSRRLSSRRSSRNASSSFFAPNSSLAFPSPESPKPALLALQQRRARKEYKPSQLSRALVSSFRFSQQTAKPEQGVAAECLRALNTGKKMRHASMLLAALPSLGGLDAELEAELSNLHKEHKMASSSDEPKVTGSSSSEHTVAGSSNECKVARSSSNECKVARSSSNECKVARSSSNEGKVAHSSSNESLAINRPSTLELLRQARLRALEEDDDEAQNVSAEFRSDEHSPSGAKAPPTPSTASSSAKTNTVTGSTASRSRAKSLRVPSLSTSPTGFGSFLSPGSPAMHAPPSPLLSTASARSAAGAAAELSPSLATNRGLSDAQMPSFTSASARFVSGAAAELSPPAKNGSLADAFPAGVVDEGSAVRSTHSSGSAGQLPVISGQAPRSSSSFSGSQAQHSSSQRRVKQSHSFSSSFTSSLGVGSTTKLHKAPSMPRKDSTSSGPGSSLERGHSREGPPSTSSAMHAKSAGGHRGSTMGLLSQALISSCALNPDQPVCRLLPVDQMPAGKKSARQSSNSMSSQLQAMSTSRSGLHRKSSRGTHAEGSNSQELVTPRKASSQPGNEL